MKTICHVKSGDAAKTKTELIYELNDLREKMIELVAMSELETVFSLLPDTYFRIDEEDTVVDFKAGQFERRFAGTEIMNPVGKKISELLPPEEAPTLIQAIHDARRDKKLTIIEYPHPGPDDLLFFEARLLPFEHHHVLGIVRDITTRKKTEEEIAQHREHLQVLVDERTVELETINQQLQEEIMERRKAEQELQSAKESAESANRLKSRFLANMSHDIRTPLNAILGFADLILKEDTDSKIRDYLKKIIKSGDALLTLINDILDFSKIEAGQMNIYPQAFLLEELSESIQSMFSYQFKQKGIYFEIHIDSPCPERIYGDKWRIHQVLTNLVSNALKFTEKGSVSLLITFSKSTDSFFFKVKDTGTGIAEKDLQTIFKPFTRLHNPGDVEKSGTGIGLTICQDLANLMGGNISVKSKTGHGSEFTFEIPAHSHQAYEEPILSAYDYDFPTDSIDPSDLNTDTNILVVDDNPVNQELIFEQLKKAGFNYLLQADNGLEAVRLAAAHSPDLVLMDIQMPGMDGNEATAELRRIGFKKPIIALSAFVMKEYIDKSIDSGANSYIIKPIDFKRFFQKIAPFLKEKKLSHPPTPDSPSLIPETDCSREQKINNTIKTSISDRIRSVFLMDVEKKLTILETSLDDSINDSDFEIHLEKIKVITHNYKGNAGFLGLKELETTAAILDKAISEKNPVPELKEMIQHLYQVLACILKENKPKT